MPTAADLPPPERGEISTASDRLRALATLSGSLTDSLGPEDAARLVEQQALSALGATSAVVVTLGGFPTDARPLTPARGALVAPELKLVHAVGLRAGVQALLTEPPPDGTVPLAEVVRDGAPRFLASERELRRYPVWGAAVLEAGARAAAVVPVWANGELRGVLGLSWPDARTFDDDERAFVLTLGVMCAQAIMRAYLRAAEWRARVDAERANRLKTEFLTTISHELRTPMNAVIGYTQLLAEELCGPVTELQKEHLGRMRASGRHLLGLIEELLDYASLESGRDVVRAEPALLLDVVEQSIGLVQSLAVLKGLHIRVEGSTDAVELYTDARKLRQILVNLLANAVKFTDAGDILLRVRVEGLGAGLRVHFEVTDTGRGIATADQEHVFEAFWRDRQISPDMPAGTGLGLPLARQLARLLGGELVVSRSAPGLGSTFVVSLPARYPGEPRTPEAARLASHRTA